MDLVIDPKNMLIVTVADADGRPRDVAVVHCAYVVVTNPSGERAVAVQLTTDVDTPAPTKPYACPPRRLKHEVLVPSRLLKVRPYTAGNPG
jgi:hypothetical protein